MAPLAPRRAPSSRPCGALTAALHDVSGSALWSEEIEPADVGPGLAGDADRAVDIGTAFEMLRRHARNHSLSIREVCRAVIDGEIDLQ